MAWIVTVSLAMGGAGVSFARRAQQVVTCPGGRFLAAGSLLDPAATTESVTVDGSTVGIGKLCAPVTGKLKPTRRKMKVKATWPACAGLKGKVRLAATLPPDCGALSGTVQARKAKIKKSFSASRSTCGDGVLDADGGEECEGGTGCGPDDRCADGCRCASSPTTTTTTTTTTLPLVSFANEVQDILDRRCAALPLCHGQQLPQDRLELTPPPRKSHAQLVNVDSLRCAGVKRVAPGSPDTSYMMWKLLGSAPPGQCFVGLPMPSSGGALPPQEIERLRTWIAQGALNN